MTNENHKKYFAVNIFDDEDKILFFDTLDQAKEACLDNAINQCDYAIECEEIEHEIVSKINDAVYGVILGRCKLPMREPDKDDPHESQYDYIIDRPVIVESNGWISVDERLPENHKTVLGCNAQTIFICTRVNESWFTDIGLCSCYVTHWQPLPPIPTQD